MSQATHRKGTPQMIKYTPTTGNVTAGDVILLGNQTGLTCVIAHHDIANNATNGEVAAGGGIYEVINLNNAADGDTVWWDDANDKVTTNDGGNTPNALFGYVVEDGGGGANSTCRALHKPYVGS